MSRYAIGIDLGGTKVEVCLVDDARRVLARRRVPSEPRLGREHVVDNIAGLVTATAGGAPFEAAGIGTPGTYHPGHDIMYGAPHTPLYEQPGLITSLKQRLGASLIVENDANCLALAEFYAQCHGRYRNIMAVILGTGTGSGLILEERLHRGAHGNAGEIGHMTVDPNGRPCECGRTGCAEAYFSGPSLSRRYREMTGETLTAQEISRRCQAGEPRARDLLEESARLMGRLFADCVNILDLEAIILGGGVSNIPIWYELVPAAIQAGLFGIPGRCIPVLPAILGDSAGVVGAAYLGLREMGLMNF